MPIQLRFELPKKMGFLTEWNEIFLIVSREFILSLRETFVEIQSQKSKFPK